MKKSLIHLVLLISLISVFFSPAVVSADPSSNFITKWETTDPGQTITIPTLGGGYNYDIDWGDSSSTIGATGDASHSYSTPGIHTITIGGLFPRIYFADSGDHPELVSIDQWGSIGWQSMDHAFWGAVNLEVIATDTPNLSSVTSTAFMFHGTASLTTIPNINSWDVSNVTNMENMFALSAFNSNIGSWDVSNVTDMTEMFYGNESFNQDIGNWDVSSVIAMPQMFEGATVFNQDLSDWDVSAVTDMGSTFYFAIAFNQNLSNWDVSSVTDMTNIFSNTNLSVANYDTILRSWSLLTLQTNVTFGASGRQYCGGHAGRASLISSYDWIITDAGIAAATCAFTEVPSLFSPLSSSTYARTTPLSISFLVPEDVLPGSIRLTFVPSSGPTTTLYLRDANSLVTNTFSLPLIGGFASTTEVLSVSGPSTLAEGTYTVSFSYQDTNGNSTATVTATNVTLTDPEGTLQFHLFTDNNGNGTQNVAEINGFSGATLTITKGSESETVSFDSAGDIDSAIEPGTYTLTVNVPTGYILTGGSNNFSVVITDGETTNAGSRGITASSSGSSGGGSSGGSIVYGGGTSIGSNSSSSSSSWSSSSNSSSSSSVRSSSSNNTTTVTPTDNTLPAPVPHEAKCLVGNKSPLQFTDVQNNTDINFITSFAFTSDAATHLIRGYGNQSFGPNNTLTRFELLKIAMSSNCIGGGNSSNFTHINTHFNDVPKDNSEQSKIIGEAYSRGIITGVGDKFYPNLPVSQAEMIKMMLTSSAYFNQGAPNSTLTVQVSDLPDGTFGQPLEYGRRLGILPTSFSARSTVNRNQMATMLAKYLQAMSPTIVHTS